MSRCSSGSTEDGVMIQQYTCHYRENQRWLKEDVGGQGYTTLRNEKTGKCLDVPVEVQKMG